MKTYGSFVGEYNFPIIMAFKGKNSIFDSKLFIAYEKYNHKTNTRLLLMVIIGLMQKFVPVLAPDGIASQNRNVVYFTRVKF